MKKMNSKGFTLIELLAVITIMGILMLVAIPAVSRTIENSRRDTYMDTAKTYVNAIKNAVASDEIECKKDSEAKYTLMSALPTGNDYVYRFSTIAATSGSNTIDATTATDLLEQGGKSSWGNAEVAGIIKIKKTVGGEGRTKYEYSIKMVDAGGRGFADYKPEGELRRTDVATNGLNTQYATIWVKANSETDCRIITGG